MMVFFMELNRVIETVIIVKTLLQRGWIRSKNACLLGKAPALSLGVFSDYFRVKIDFW